MTRGVLLTLGLTALVAVVAQAAGLSTGSDSLGAGNASVSPCDTDFTDSYTTVSGNVVSVTVGGIADPACEGGALSVTLTNSSGSALSGGGPVTIPTDPDTVANAVTVPIGGAPDADLVAGIRILVSGP